MASITGPRAVKPLVLLLLALLVAGAAAGVTLSLTQAQAANGVYDTDGDKLIEISYLEQLDALRYDPDGDGAANETTDSAAYAAAFPVNAGEVVCASNCSGYELAKSLDFDQAASYSSGSVNTAWTNTTGDGWTPILHTDANNATKGYGAVLEGNGYTISNLYSSGTSADRETGLFAVIESGGAVRSLGLTSVNIVGGYNNTGALVGNNKGSITGSHSTGAISGKGDTGGLVGNNNGSIGKSYSAGTVSGNEDYVGGLVGDNIGTIVRSYSSSNVWGHKNYVGGLAGYSLGSITYSHASGNVQGGIPFSPGGSAVGGLLGKNLGSVSASYATGMVVGRQKIGGLTGVNTGSIKASYAYGAVSAGVTTGGGLVGYNSDNQQGTTIIQSSYATGKVTAGDNAGGLVGENSASVENSYSTGVVNSKSTKRGLIGESSSGTASASYWDTETSSVTDPESEQEQYGYGKTTSELQTPTTTTGIYANWTTGGVWDFGTASQYPALKADVNNDGTATVGEFGSQRSSQTPAATATPTPTPTATPTPEPTATPTPEPTPTPVPATLTTSGESATTVTLNIANHSDEWYYQYTSPIGGTCSSAVTAGTVAATATGLSFNTAYAFAAYSDSGCSTELAAASSVTTLTPSLTASGIKHNGAELTISGWDNEKDGAWYAKGYTPCSAAISSQQTSVTGLDPDKNYTYEAYSDSTCTTAITGATVTFKTLLSP